MEVGHFPDLQTSVEESRPELVALTKIRLHIEINKLDFIYYTIDPNDDSETAKTSPSVLERTPFALELRMQISR